VIGLVLDTTALVAYANGIESVGIRVAQAADDSLEVLVPALCLAQAYREAGRDAYRLLDVLVQIPNVVVGPVERRHCSVLGGWSHVLETLDLAQVAIEAAAYGVVPVMTSRADLLHRVLPHAWPIIAP